MSVFLQSISVARPRETSSFRFLLKSRPEETQAGRCEDELKENNMQHANNRYMTRLWRQRKLYGLQACCLHDGNRSGRLGRRGGGRGRKRGRGGTTTCSMYTSFIHTNCIMYKPRRQRTLPGLYYCVHDRLTSQGGKRARGEG